MANIDIKKLFVRVNGDVNIQSFKSAVENGDSTRIDSSKIYFLSTGEIYAAGRYFNEGGDARIEEIEAAIDLLNAGPYKLDESGNPTEEYELGSVQGQVKKAVDTIMGEGDIAAAFDTIKEIADWLNSTDEDGKHDTAQKIIDSIHSLEQSTGVDGVISGDAPSIDGDGNLVNNLTTTSTGVFKKIDDNEIARRGDQAMDRYLITVNSDAITKEIQDRIDAINALDASFNVTSTDGHVKVEIAETDGVISDLKVTGSDIASAQSLQDLTLAHNKDVAQHNKDVNALNANDTTFKSLIGTSSADADQKINITWYTVSPGNDPVENQEQNVPTIWGKLNALSNADADTANKIDTIEASVGLSEDGAHVTTTGNYTSAATTVVGEIAALDAQVKTNEDAIALLNDADTVVGSVANSIKTTVESLDASVDAKDAKEYVATSVTEADGVLTDTTVVVTYGDYDTPTNGIATVEDTKKYVDDNITALEVTAEGDDYVDAKVDAATDNKHVIVATNVVDLVASAGAPAEYDAEGTETVAATAAELTGTAKSLADAADIATKVKTYVDGKVAIEAARADAKVLNSIKALDSEVTDKDDKEFVTTTTVQEDGKLASTTVEVVYAEHTDGVISDGIVDAATLNAVLGDLWETFVAN